MSLGTYPEVSLKRAREKRDEARKLIADGVDPAATRKAKKLAQVETFEGVAAEWLELQRQKFTAKTMLKAEWTFRDLLNPYIGSRPIKAITSPEILAVLRRLESRGKHETAHRTKHARARSSDMPLPPDAQSATRRRITWRSGSSGDQQSSGYHRSEESRRASASD